MKEQIDVNEVYALLEKYIRYDYLSKLQNTLIEHNIK
jgi:hypothetical protein